MSNQLNTNPAYAGYPSQVTTTTGGTIPSGYLTYPSTLGQDTTIPDHRDREIASLRTCLHEAYAEIGRLHEQLRGLQAFDRFSEGMKKEQHG